MLRVMKARLVFLHGLESGPHGSKYQALREIDPDVIAPDCSGLDRIAERLLVIERCLEGVEKMMIVGSSFGGLAALLFAQRPGNRERVAGCLLCAPAISLAAPGEITWVPQNTIVLQGLQDDLVPWQESEAFCNEHQLEFILVDDDHRLSNSRPRVVEIARQMCLRFTIARPADPVPNGHLSPHG